MTAVGSTPNRAPVRGTVRGRFAPSPTGPLHFGSLIAALGSFLEIRQHGGEWLVRIEDVDAPRAVPGAAAAILRTLERYGLHWDGPVVYQSRRTTDYQTALECLLGTGLVYPCSCSRRDLASCLRGRDGALIYPGTCRGGIRSTHRPCALRLRVGGTPIRFRDAIQGEYRQRLDREVGDFVLRRADGLFTYQLAVVVDDAVQGVTHVVRGADLLDSTPRQIYLQRLLGLPTPDYAHLPVAVDARGSKLSKQTGAPPLDERDPGPGLWAALRFLGQTPPEVLQQESPAAILAWARLHWRLERVPGIPARPWQSPPLQPTAPDGLTRNAKAVDNVKTMD